MKLTELLFYQEKSSEENHGMTSLDELSVPSLIDDKPCWRKPTTKSVDKKKTEELLISRSEMTNPADWNFANLENIKYLEIKQSKISQAILTSYLEKVSDLHELRLTQVNIDIDPNAQLKLEHLEKLELSACDNATDLLDLILKNSKSLKSLILKNLDLMNELDWAAINLSSLEEVEIEECDFAEDFISKLIAKAPNIKSLKINGYVHLTSDTLNQPLSKLERLMMTTASPRVFPSTVATFAFCATATTSTPDLSRYKQKRDRTKYRVAPMPRPRSETP